GFVSPSSLSGPTVSFLPRSSKFSSVVVFCIVTPLTKRKLPVALQCREGDTDETEQSARRIGRYPRGGSFATHGRARRRRRGELLGAGFVRELGGGAAAAGVDCRRDLLPLAGAGGRRRCQGARDHHRPVQPNRERQSVR